MPSSYGHLKKLVNKAPSSEATALINYLADIYGTAVISGQHEGELPEHPEIGIIESASGKLPALRSLDYINYSSAIALADDVTERALDWYRDRNGIVSICGHWYSPLHGNPGAKSFYTKDTSFDLTRALKPGTPEHAALMTDIDIVAAQLTRLRDAGVPVLWRPLHEADGGWFWWGAKGPEPCKELYWLMYDRFTNVYGLNNLIWVWTFASNDLALDWYPGDQYVDIVGIDKYFTKGDYNPNAEGFQRLTSYAGDRKLITMPENGGIPDPDRLISERAGWLWFCTWWGGFITGNEFNTSEHIKKVYNHPYIITLDKLPDLRTYGR